MTLSGWLFNNHRFTEGGAFGISATMAAPCPPITDCNGGNCIQVTCLGDIRMCPVFIFLLVVWLVLDLVYAVIMGDFTSNETPVPAAEIFRNREELGKNINADEAAAMGAVYQAAALSKAFKVKPFLVRDAAVFPIQVSLVLLETTLNHSSRHSLYKPLVHVEQHWHF